jgi:hypothetical protein
MAEGQQSDTEAYLARVRKTIADSEMLVEAARLRIAETDRMLEKQGLTREQVMNFRFSPEQREAVNRELAMNGLDPIETWEEEDSGRSEDVMREAWDASRASSIASDSPDGELAERQRKFGMMMKPFQI